MANPHGSFIWYELMTSDIDAAAGFYGAVVGWTVAAFPGSQFDYRIFSFGPGQVAGLMTIPAEAAAMGAKPGWLGYVGVDDVDKAAADIVRDGGKQHVPPTDIPGVGRFAMMSDPQGAPFYVMRGAVEGTSESFAPTKTGHCHWNELMTSDHKAAMDFYLGRFNWEKGEAMPMEGMGDYQFINQGGQMIGAMMTSPPGGPPPMWNYYFGVADIDAAKAAIEAKGGKVAFGPMEVPGGVFAMQGIDPQGASFGLVGPRKS